jgi:hypothetical protein
MFHVAGPTTPCQLLRFDTKGLVTLEIRRSKGRPWWAEPFFSVISNYLTQFTGLMFPSKSNTGGTRQQNSIDYVTMAGFDASGCVNATRVPIEQQWIRGI